MPTKNTKKTICFISPAIYPLLQKNSKTRSAGGAEAQFKAIGSELAKKGYNVHFITDDYGQEPTEKINDIWTHKTSFRYLGQGKKYLPLDWIKLIITANKINADFYFIKVPKDLLFPLGIFCRLTRGKLIYVGQSDKDVNIKLLLTLQNKFAVYLYRAGMSFVDYAVAQTKIQLQGFKKFGKPTSIIKNVVTLHKPALEEKKNYILWVGNDTTNKQAELVPELALQLPNYTFKMILATADDSILDKTFRQKSVEIKNFDYIGFVPFRKIAHYFAHATLLINTSVREGFPNVFLQAWQNGTPVISLHVDPDRIISTYGIGMCASGNLQTMCDSINTLMKNHDLLKKMRNKSVDYVQQEHDLQKGINEYIKIIDSL